MRPLLAGNWKMNGLAPQLREIEAVAVAVAASSPLANILLCLPATLIARGAQTAAGRIAIGGENCHPDAAGAFTGEVSAEMLRDAGAAAVIVGHSERRQKHGESDVLVNAKANAARRAGLLAVICIGETKSQRLQGKALTACTEQISGSVPEAMTSAEFAIGYEPLWAIGSGQVPTTEEISQMHAHIRASLATRMGVEGSKVRILYGGSVKPSTAREILALPDVGGVLVGGASLKAVDFAAIVMVIPSTA